MSDHVIRVPKRRPGAPPFGWVLRDGSKVKDDREQRVLDRIHALHAAGVGDSDIARVLNSQKLRPRRAEAWYPHSVTVVRIRDENYRLKKRLERAGKR